jgi:hypothetical protein
MKYKNNDRKMSKKGEKPQGKQNYERSKKTKIEDYFYYLGSAKQATDFEETTEFVLNYIKKEFDLGIDIATALKKLEPLNTDEWIPTMNLVTETDAVKKEAQLETNRIVFKTRFDNYEARKRTYLDNCVKAYALLWERCTKGMRNRIEARTDFANNIEYNPIELLKAIKEHSLNYQEHRYPASVVYDAMTTMMGVKQKEGESLHEYTRRFRTAKEVFESHLGGTNMQKRCQLMMKVI